MNRPLQTILLASAATFSTLMLGACAHQPQQPVLLAQQILGPSDRLPPTFDGHGDHYAIRLGWLRLAELGSFMQGSFSSAQQARDDQEFLDIRLHMARIWPDRTDGTYLYVEQATAQALDRPYRQRVYRVTSLSPLSFKSEVFELPGSAEEIQKNFAGKWQEPQAFSSVTPDALRPRTGCHIILNWQSTGVFSGSTEDRKCPSELRGASYATSEVTIDSEKLVSWDRGFDANGKQVWGAVKGGYIFRRDQPVAEQN
jgi:CpeT protein